MTTDDRKQDLIEAAAKAMFEDVYGAGDWEWREQIEEKVYVDRARIAFAVFEAAQKPTDDEREVLWDAFDELHRITEGGCDTRGEDVADMVLGLGFRRPVTPAPSVERCYWCNQPARGTAVWQGDGDRYASCGQEGHGTLFAPSEPQGEPTDAQVEAGLQEWWYGEHGDTWEDKMRAALRAAGEVKR